MNGYEHYKEAEHFIRCEGREMPSKWAVSMAQVHATLALTAAQANPQAFRQAMNEDGNGLSSLPKEKRTEPSKEEIRSDAAAFLDEGDV